jgi:hypothetical protein
MVISLESLVLSNDVEEFVTSVLQSQHWICYRTLVCASTLILGVPRAIFVAWGGHQQEPEGQLGKASFMLACRQDGCRRHLRLGRAAVVSHGRAVGLCYFHTCPTNPFLRCQRLRASFLPRAFAAFDPGHGSRGGASAQVFAESATLALIIPQAMNLSRRIGSNRSWPRWTTIHD